MALGFKSYVGSKWRIGKIYLNNLGNCLETASS